MNGLSCISSLGDLSIFHMVQKLSENQVKFGGRFKVFKINFILSHKIFLQDLSSKLFWLGGYHRNIHHSGYSN